MRPFYWAYGVTTCASRLTTLLPKTLESLARAGFDSPRLFVDGLENPKDCPIQGLPVTARYPAVRTAGNWVLSLYELYCRMPAAHRFAVFQDDLLAVQGLREYLERCEYPKKGYLNLYTFPKNFLVANGRTGWYPSDQLGKSALGLVFSRDAVIDLLGQRCLVDRFQDPQRGWQSIDGGIVTALKQVNYKEYVHNPSLLQHTGHVSSMGHGQFPQANSFPGEEFDATSLIEERI